MAPSAAIGSTIAGFRLQRLLGQGGMGVVYLALEEELERPVALKLLALELSEDASFRERFLREAKLAASLDHSCVVPVYRAGDADGLLYLAMRYVEGEDLGSLIAREGPLPRERTLALVSSLGSALDSAHARGLVHRDVKPANVLIDAEGHPYLCDFGIARSQDAAQLTKTGALTGTFAYLAPEVIEGRSASPASDLYALACLAYECVSGSPPFHAEHEAALIYQQLKDAPPSLGAHPQLDAVFHRALAKQPAERFGSCQAFYEALMAPPAARKSAATVQLPIAATSFLGRERELDEAAELLAGGRLLTITGPGGTGKTRFAAELARRQAQGYADGVHWVALATIRDPTLVSEAIGRALEVQGRLQAEIADKHLLLCLDNLEQVIDCAPELAELVEACPKLTLLVTSRELLRVRAETEYPLPALADDDGVSLFCERSGVEPSQHVAGLCSHLEGLPLAIELAAARTRLLSPEQLLERLSSRLDLLKGTRDADPRQHTLRATIDWSYELLSPDEQRLFARLSVFSGGCTLETAEAVAEADLDLLESLLDKSLLRRSQDRFWMLETIREYASEKLEESGEEGELRQRHAEWFVELVEEFDDRLRGPELESWLSRLDAEQGNLRAALGQLVEVAETDELLEFLNRTANYWRIRGVLVEAREWFEHGLGASAGQRTSRRARLLRSAATVYSTLGEHDTARALDEESLAISRETGDQRDVVSALISLGMDLLESRQFSQARSVYEEALASARAADDDLAVSVALGNLSCLAQEDGDFPRAIALATEAVVVARKVGNPEFVSSALETLASAYLLAGRLEHAIPPAREAVETSGRLRDIEALPYDLILMAALAARRGNAAGAAQLVGVEEALRKEHSAVLQWLAAASLSETERLLQAELGAGYETLVAEGGAMSLEEAVELALELVPEPSPVASTLPAPTTSFLGRERELAEAAGLLATSRLLTISGPGGAGKTRFALELGRRQAQGYPDGVYWVPLATLTDPTLVREAIARALEINGDLADEVGDTQMLVLLDNLEQVVEAAPELASLLSACRRLTLVCTSRERLRVQLEAEYELPALEAQDGVSIFCERSSFEASDAIRELCARLEGLPLAIELAAARTRLLSPEQLLERLSGRLDLLKGARDADPRQQTLRATIDWSYELLTQDEQQLFQRLSIFTGGCTLEAAEAVCDADIETLESLLDKSLVRRRKDRFTMLETIRQYASERLEGSGQNNEVRQRHAEFFIELADRRHVDLRGRDAALWLQRFEDEHSNFRAVLGYVLERSDAQAALRLAGALSRFWMIRGHLDEGRRWLETTLQASPSAGLRPRALQGLALIAMEQGDVDRADEAAAEALRLSRESDDAVGIAQSSGLLADVAAYKGDLDKAAPLWEEAAELARCEGYRMELALALYNLGHVARLHGEVGRAQKYFEESHANFSELEDVMGQAGTLSGLVQVALDSGDDAGALSMLIVATELYSRIRYVAGLLDSLELFATIVERRGESATAARLWGARYTLGSEIGRETDHPLETGAHNEAVARVRSTLGDEAFEQAWERGAAMTLEEAVELALEAIPEPQAQ